MPLYTYIGACSPGHTRALPGLFRIMHTHNTRTGCEDTWSPAYIICVHRCKYSLQCSDKIRLPQSCFKCGIAKSCPGTHTALQVPVQLSKAFFNLLLKLKKHKLAFNFQYCVGDSDIIGHYYLPQQLPHNGFLPWGTHTGSDCGSTGPPLTDLWSNPSRETNIN